ncbi:MAG: ferredoxin [Leptospiraceae bacterium]|nr:ferredoxin [Leptospiraceae bacterium]|tara:strand:+ start:250 stop:654 length:405 start_codon:yes stop_codon:yes gene_type:complete
MAKLEEIEGIGPKYASTLRKAGVRSIGDLLKKGSTPDGRKTIAKDSGLSPKLILEWVNHSDLMRIKGVGEEYSDLLEEAGVDTVVELAQRKAANLHEAMAKTNEKKKLVRQMPSESKIQDWISQAKKLPRVIKY